jgi:predicted RNase H-like nuclease
MAHIVGVDGCKTGWVAIREELASGAIEWRVAARFRDFVLTDLPPRVLAVDIPIGLPDMGSRECDRRARSLLGPGRASSVFPAPLRAVTPSDSHADASAARKHIEGKGMSIQAWAIVPKVREVDDLLRGNRSLLASVYEVHPEVSFFHIAGGRPMRLAKRRLPGRNERLALLRPIFGEVPVQAVQALRRHGALPDDVLDAFAALWTARRILAGQAIVLPEQPPRDGAGLPMQIVA